MFTFYDYFTSRVPWFYEFLNGCKAPGRLWLRECLYAATWEMVSRAKFVVACVGRAGVRQATGAVGLTLGTDTRAAPRAA